MSAALSVGESSSNTQNSFKVKKKSFKNANNKNFLNNFKKNHLHCYCEKKGYFVKKCKYKTNLGEKSLYFKLWES